MNKKIERAVDEIILLYYQGFSARFAINSVLEKLDITERYELTRLLEKTVKTKRKAE